jgi:hypothetical protein
MMRGPLFAGDEEVEETTETGVEINSGTTDLVLIKGCFLPAEELLLT